ncbi:MAG TPA: beta-ketoacyl-ACP synthase III [Alphaproteobacteria bacterium]|nr:ketoacyl-ACP synthase III [Micavibrio sp.]HQX27060.1 beta-ketoacyl-ACP synthase III [Alphaproteobacteria bacterium]
MGITAIIRATGGYLPKKIVTNADLEKLVDTSDEWIVKRTGIRERRLAEAHETTGTMAIEAGKQALANAKLEGKDIDTVIVATTTPDKKFPAVAVNVQQALGIPPGPAFDVQAVCTGFVYALGIANSFIQTGVSKRVLVIGAEKMSSIVDWKDRTTCVLFADGAGAAILEANTKNDGRGVISTHLYADGRFQDLLYADPLIVMEGREVFKNAVQFMADVVEEVLEKNNLKSEDISLLVPHQANIRIIEATAKKLNLSMDKVVTTVERHGNTSAASIPLALHEAMEAGRIKSGDLVLLEGMGGGLTWGALLVRF